MPGSLFIDFPGKNTGVGRYSLIFHLWIEPVSLPGRQIPHGLEPPTTVICFGWYCLQGRISCSTPYAPTSISKHLYLWRFRASPVARWWESADANAETGLILLPGRSREGHVSLQCLLDSSMDRYFFGSHTVHKLEPELRRAYQYRTSTRASVWRVRDL